MSFSAASSIGGRVTTETPHKLRPSAIEQLHSRSARRDRVRSLSRSHRHLLTRGAIRTDQIALAAVSVLSICHKICLKLIVITRVCDNTPSRLGIFSMTILTILGVGGWLIPRDNTDHNSNAIIDNDNDSRAASSSRRPDATPTTFRRRSFGASSSGINSPEILNTPSLPRHSTSTSLSRQAGSPQSYFINNAPAARSTTSINSRRDSNSRRNSRANRTDGSTE